MLTTALDPRVQMIQDYGDAWNRHAVDDLMEFHSEDIVWTLPSLRWENVGKSAVRAAFSRYIEHWPDCYFTVRRIRYGGDIISVETYLDQTLAKPFEMGGVVIQPNGKSVRIDLVDLFTINGEGKICRKDSYMNVPYQQLILEGVYEGGKATAVS